ncbi:hypothetical protein ACFL5C_00420 [Candidatus Omnitrophota bacterium]
MVIIMLLLFACMGVTYMIGRIHGWDKAVATIEQNLPYIRGWDIAKV